MSFSRFIKPIDRSSKPHFVWGILFAATSLSACSGESSETQLDGGGLDGSGGGSLASDGSGGAVGTASGGGGNTPESGGASATGGTTASGGADVGSGGTAEEACGGVRDILSEPEFNSLFPKRNETYSYQGMVDAIEGNGDLIGFPAFATSGDCVTRKRELAAFLANVARETGQLVYIEQIDKSFVYCDQSKNYGCPAGSNAYFGRGPIQLSWNYNYRAASLALFGDDRLLQTPEMVANDPAIAWATGFWFWMVGGAGGDGSNSPHSAMQNGEGFGATINIINGYEECNGGVQSYAQEAVSQRVCYYEKYTEAFGVSVGPGDLNCGTTTSNSYCQGI